MKKKHEIPKKIWELVQLVGDFWVRKEFNVGKTERGTDVQQAMGDLRVKEVHPRKYVSIEARHQKWNFLHGPPDLSVVELRLCFIYDQIKPTN